MAYSMSSRFVRVVRECVAAVALVGLMATGAVAEEKKEVAAAVSVEGIAATGEHLTGNDLAADAKAAAAKEGKAVSGSVEFDCPGLPEANLEFNLSQGMVKDLFGIGDAAITGAFQGWAKAAGLEPADTECMPKAAHQMLELVGQVVQGLHVRVYEYDVDIKKVSTHYSRKLIAQKWETVLRLRERAIADETLYVVNVLRNNGAIKGVFVLVYDGDETILVNAVCDVSPENVLKLASSAAALGVMAELDSDLSTAALNFLWTSNTAESAPPAAKPALPLPVSKPESPKSGNPPPAPVGDKDS